jgi:ribosomal-protein-alanine N-acetyltransferase
MGQKQLTLIAALEDILLAPAGVPAYRVRAITARDREALADLYLATYPEEIVKDIAEARAEFRITFKGEYGPLDFDASLLALDGERPIAGVLTVTEVPWPDTPCGPFIIEVMVHPDHRGEGLALHLIQEAAQRLVKTGNLTVALRVMSGNIAALNLYSRLGFREWAGGPR